jgi:hypothetical protein
MSQTDQQRANDKKQATCLPGLQGFPIQVIGWSGFLEKNDILTPNDIHLQFSPSETPMSYDKKTGSLTTSGNSTFFMGGTNYTVRVVRYCAPKQDGLASFSGVPMAEFQIWGIPNGSGTKKADIAVLIVPIRQSTVGSEAGTKILNALYGSAVRLVDMIPHGKGVDILKYSTCIETQANSTITLAVAYWSKGAAVTQDLVKENKIKDIELKAFGIPNILGFNLLTSFSILDDEKRSKIDRRYQVKDEMLQTYSTSIALNVSSPEFKNGFRLIPDFIHKKKITDTTKNFKCIAIDRSRDIKNGKLVVDPATGKRLDDEIAEARQQEEEIGKPGPGAGTIWLTICKILGIILGISFLAGIVVFLSYYFFASKSNAGSTDSAAADAVVSATQAVANAAAAAKVAKAAISQTNTAASVAASAAAAAAAAITE